ncbi:hypothetical protein [Kineococcus indalonis]|uniref:hypothetical protein n=1 Tax=Kineococcus indalonis TaxID=2696566 RepID=UPI001411FBA9|nr:hypothetical protein [Kineococcus indalonis]NAZ87221.1 hypothetical protein [Kineococcus indalonis]
MGDLDRYVRQQFPSHFGILASDENPASSALIDGLHAARKEEVVAGAMTVLIGNSQQGRAQREADEGLNQRLYRHFRSTTRQAWLRAAAAVVGNL